MATEEQREWTPSPSGMWSTVILGFSCKVWAGGSKRHGRIGQGVLWHVIIEIPVRGNTAVCHFKGYKSKEAAMRKANRAALAAVREQKEGQTP